MAMKLWELTFAITDKAKCADPQDYERGDSFHAITMWVLGWRYSKRRHCTASPESKPNG